MVVVGYCVCHCEVGETPDVFEETGHTVCGILTLICEMEELSEVENINLFKVHSVTRKARSKNSDPVRKLRGPVLASHCNKVCPVCVESLDKKKMPTLALANGLWIKDILAKLQDLTYVEQLLIAKVHKNRCIVKVSSGVFMVQANAISFSNPMPKIYNVLPSTQVLVNKQKPTLNGHQWLKVSKALHWLKLNHVDYYDCEISEKNLASYPEDGPPVVVDYYPSNKNKSPESTSVNNMDEKDGNQKVFVPCSSWPDR